MLDLVLVDGLPSQRKTTLAAELAPALDPPSISKNALKEAISDGRARGDRSSAVRPPEPEMTLSNDRIAANPEECVRRGPSPTVANEPFLTVRLRRGQLTRGDEC